MVVLVRHFRPTPHATYFTVFIFFGKLFPFGNDTVTILDGIIVERFVRTVHDNFNAIFIVDVLELRLFVADVLSAQQFCDQCLQR